MSIDELIALLVLMYTNMEDEILRSAAEHMGLSGTADADDLNRWRMEHLVEASAFDRDVSRIIRSYQPQQREITGAIIERAAADQTAAVDAAVQSAVYAGTAAPYVVSIVRADTVSNPYRAASRAAEYYKKQALHDINTVNTVMKYKAKQGFVTAVNSAFFTAKQSERVWKALGEGALSTANGTESLQSAVRKSLHKMAEKGIPAFIDKAGREWTPEAYVRMVLRTTAANTARKAQFDRCDEYGISLIEVDAHAGARPLCAPYQGRIFSRDGTSGKVKDGSGREFDYIPLDDTSYGQAAGLFGINCGHRPYPFSPGISFKTYSPLETEQELKENSDKYKLFQKQRALERQIRAAKRDCMVDDAAGDRESYEKSAKFLAQSRRKYSDFCKKNHLPEHQDRTQVYGFDRSQGAKAVWSERKRLEKVTAAKSQQTAYQNAVKNTKRDLLDIDAKRKGASGAELDRLNKEYNAKAAELKAHEKTLADFSRANGLSNKANAVRVEGFGKAQAASATRAVHNAKGNELKFNKISGQKEIDKGLKKELTGEYSKFTSTFGELTTVNSVEAQVYMGHGVFGGYNDNSGTLTLYGAGGKEGKKFMQDSAIQHKKDGDWSTNSPMHTFRHELGHAWQKQLKKTDTEYSTKVEKIQVMKNDFWKDLTSSPDYDTMDLKKEQGKVLSAYGLGEDNDIDELISESVAEYLTEKPRPFAQSVIDILTGKE